MRSGDLVRYLSDAEHGRLLAAVESCSLVVGDVALGRRNVKADRRLIALFINKGRGADVTPAPARGPSSL